MPEAVKTLEQIADEVQQDHTARRDIPQTPLKRRGKRLKGPPRSKYQGKPCKFGHPGMRYSSTGSCVECQSAFASRQRERARAVRRARATSTESAAAQSLQAFRKMLEKP